jgi:nitroreductase
MDKNKVIMIRDIIIKNRSYRKFDPSVQITREHIINWIELARFSASGRNMQPLKYVYSTDKQLNKKIFPNLGWAGYLKDWDGPGEGERPAAYIAVLLDRSLASESYCDDGIAMQSILLGAVEEGFGGCIVGTVDKKRVAELLGLPDNMEILWMIALGKPAEKVVLETAKKGDIKYWRDKEEIHHVPKRPLDELVYKGF